MDYLELRQSIKLSLRRQENIFNHSLLLNPVENIPFKDDISTASSFLHGLYNTDKLRTPDAQLNTPIQFSGRGRISYDIQKIYKAWATALGASDVSMRLLSGLHAHIILFMGISNPGDSVLLLPELAGGHMSTKAILERLGLRVMEMIVDKTEMSIDLERTVKKYQKESPDFIFVDRSEGLTVEDFTPLVKAFESFTIFDASQYLTNIIAGDHPNPFASNFDLMISSMHKNFPGPQRAMVATKQRTPVWSNLLNKISTYVSNMHVFGIYTAGLTLSREEWLKRYSGQMLQNAVILEDALYERGVPVVRRKREAIPTHHLWIEMPSHTEAFNKYRDLERCRIMTNYRRLPYGIGYGLRLGLSSATRQGLTPESISGLADIITMIYERGATKEIRCVAQEFICSVIDYPTLI